MTLDSNLWYMFKYFHHQSMRPHTEQNHYEMVLIHHLLDIDVKFHSNVRMCRKIFPTYLPYSILSEHVTTNIIFLFCLSTFHILYLRSNVPRTLPSNLVATDSHSFSAMSDATFLAENWKRKKLNIIKTSKLFWKLF